MCLPHSARVIARLENTGMSTQFRDDRRGNFAIVSAVAAIPLVMAAGVAVDLATISQHKSELQHAIDAAVLAVAREGKAVSDQQAENIANTFITNNLDPSHTKMVVVRDGSVVSLRAEARAPMAFGALFGYDQYPVVAAATADVAFVSYEIALVLDTTGSMAGGKLVAMQDAVTGMIDSMSSQVTEKEKLKFSLVPFSNFVNVGPQHGPKFDAKGKMVKGSGAEWLDLKGKVKIPQQELVPGLSRFELYNHLGIEWAGCVETRQPTKKHAYDTDAIEGDARDKHSLFVPAFHIDEPDSWEYQNSYIASDADPLDDSNGGKAKKLKKYGVPDGMAASLLGTGGDDEDDDGGSADLAPVPIDTSNGKGPGASCHATPIEPLTNDYGTITSRVADLVASGTTNIMEGVAWGHRVLTPSAPFAEAAKPTAGLEKIMIVLTDGANVMGVNNTALKSGYTSYGFLVDGRLGVADGSAASTNTLMNQKTLEACEHAKEEGIILYTIRLEEPDVKTGTMLQECATSEAHYFDAPSRSQLDEVFQVIRSRIVRVRISS
jgi:Flp pilus assembly protein TadG